MVDEGEKQKAREDAYRLISYRDRSVFELKKRLLQKGHDIKVIEEIIPRIKELDYLNDKRFAKKWIRHKVKHSPKGKYLLIKELKDKGVDEKTINEALNSEYPYGLEYKTAVKLAKKWKSKSHNKDKELVKLKVYLKNKGFRYEIISDVVKDISD
ncbi:MAG TPA: regulatory protein RecX [Halanaerobiales bacterium]|nr:regulatory protein RecX [Halanaerobiales bacterium]